MQTIANCQQLLNRSDYRNLTKPVVHPEIWQDVPNKQIHPTKVMADQEQDRARDQQSKVRQQDQVLVLLFIKWTLRVEMVDATIAILPTDTFAFKLPVVEVVACHVGKKVQRPATQLLLE